MTETGIIAGTGWEDSKRIKVGITTHVRDANADYVKGHVGWPLYNVKLRLWDKDANQEVPRDTEDQPGEVEVSGLGIFNECVDLCSGHKPCADDFFLRYWHLSEVTTSEFHDGWFKTGDIAVYSSDHQAKGQLRILGRNSTDIIKSGGEKLSAIEIERVILELEGMKDVAVVGIEDEEWGQVVSPYRRLSEPSQRYYNMLGADAWLAGWRLHCN